MTAEYFNFLSLIGVAFFAISGALLGHDKDIGGFGVVVVGSVTALGGGTLRDILLNQPVFWIANPDYLYATYGAIFIRSTLFMVHYRFIIGNRFSKIGRTAFWLATQRF